MWYIFQRLNKNEFKPGTEVEKQGSEAKGYKRTQKRAPQEQPQYDTNPDDQHSSLVTGAQHKLTLQKPWPELRTRGM